MQELCEALGEFGIWVRLHYVYPYPHVDQVVPLMAEGKILPYLDVPLQHGSPEVLQRMKRPAAAEKSLDRIQALYDQVYSAWEPYGHLASRLPDELRERHARIYAEAVRQARAKGWDPELGEEEDA